MSTWTDLIPGCFAGMTAPFAVHATDEKQALEMLKSMQEAGITFAEADAAIRDYLVSKQAPQDHIDTQMKRVTERLRPWLA